ncbi:MAG: heavy metal sensor histidine kinase [Syntrophales bacterium]|nr:heavy metal sensor histidine kinase [Syntrophales bacterium]MDD5640496.1 heavy metal sensor histidine kinase [Syntrophales bacterium]
MILKSIGARLTFWYAAILSVTLLVLGGTAYGLLAYSLSHDLDASLQGVAKMSAEQAGAANGAFLPPDVDELFRHFFGFSPLNRSFEMFDTRGRRNLPQPGSRAGKLPLSPQAFKNALRGLSTFETLERSGPYPFRVLTMPVIKAGRVVNLVQVGISLENVIETRRRFLLIMAGVLPLGLLLATAGGWVLARRALKPVDQMTRAARRISGEDLTERLQETGTDDELDRLAKTLNEMLGRLDDFLGQIRQFSADAAHELQTPLTILKGEIEVALRSPRTPVEYQQVLNSSLEEIERISSLVAGLLLLARADRGVLRLDLRPLDLPELLQEVGEQLRLVAENREVSLNYGVLEPSVIQGDREHFQRLLLNLIDNAIKYTPAGGSVTLSLRCLGQEAQVAITDTGLGLTEEEQAQIFHRFYRAEAARSQSGGGAGLGLSIAQSIAAAHGGKIEVESLPGRGSTFTVSLPGDCQTTPNPAS